LGPKSSGTRITDDPPLPIFFPARILSDAHADTFFASSIGGIDHVQLKRFGFGESLRESRFPWRITTAPPCQDPYTPSKGEKDSVTRVIRLRKLKETARLPAVYWLAGSCSGCELDGLCFLGCGSDVAGGLGEASEFGAVVVVVVEVEFLAWQHRL
jgi:hypothetical protein